MYVIQAGIDVLHYCCMDVVGWKRVEAGLQIERCGFMWVLRSKSVDPMPCTSEALTAQYLNVRQRKLGTIIIQTVHILQHNSADTGSLPDGKFWHGQPNSTSN
jgi:hypothetical protein